MSHYFLTCQESALREESAISLVEVHINMAKVWASCELQYWMYPWLQNTFLN